MTAEELKDAVRKYADETIGEGHWNSAVVKVRVRNRDSDEETLVVRPLVDPHRGDSGTPGLRGRAAE